MSAYVYTIRAENKTIDGKLIHVAKYAGKPWHGLDGARLNRGIDLKVGTAQRTFEKRGYVPEYFVVISFDPVDDEPVEVYENLRGLTAFYDDSTLGVDDRAPIVGHLHQGANGKLNYVAV